MLLYLTMNTNQCQLAFASLSSFTTNSRLRNSEATQHVSTSPNPQRATMVAPKRVRRNEEIKRLTKQLEQLRVVRDKMKKKTPSSPSPSSSSSPANTSQQKQSPPPVQPPPASNATSVKLGKHSEGSRFLSITDFPTDEYFPRIIPVPGTVPGLTVAQLDATPSLHHSKTPEFGNVFVTNVSNEYQGDLIAMPMPNNISEYVDPVVLKVKPTELSVFQLPCDENDFVYVILDRDNVDSFDNTKFYAWDVDGMVKIGWAKSKPEEGDARCLGRILLGVLEVRKDLRKEKSCWEEENEAYG